MERVLGIGGVFLRSSTPDALSAWYRDKLVADLDAMLEHLRSAGAEVEPRTETMDGVGRVVDPEGNRIELWQAV